MRKILRNWNEGVLQIALLFSHYRLFLFKSCSAGKHLRGVENKIVYHRNQPLSAELCLGAVSKFLLLYLPRARKQNNFN